jgi:hypothetical protein
MYASGKAPDEKEILQNHADALEKRLKDVRRQLDGLDKSE